MNVQIVRFVRSSHGVGNFMPSIMILLWLSGVWRVEMLECLSGRGIGDMYECIPREKKKKVWLKGMRNSKTVSLVIVLEYCVP